MRTFILDIDKCPIKKSGVRCIASQNNCRAYEPSLRSSQNIPEMRYHRF